ncbi:hypothetical protein AB0H03_06645 [Streptomyces sparsogenes]|uniref:hypothetical protein n=1 Tax=Streptomyces sparsogenes TaxID=67365 RepID=UPI0033C4168E
MRIRNAIAAVGIGSALAIGGLATPAQADTSARVYQGDDYAEWNDIDNTDVVTVCDRERDGNGVYVKVWLRDGYDEFADENGSASPCYSRTYWYDAVAAIQVCEDEIGPDWCSDKRYV